MGAASIAWIVAVLNSVLIFGGVGGIFWAG